MYDDIVLLAIMMHKVLCINFGVLYSYIMQRQLFQFWRYFVCYYVYYWVFGFGFLFKNWL